MTKRMLIEGVTVPAPCPVCDGALRWEGRAWRLTCRGCGLAGGITLHPDEARDLAWHLALPGLQDTSLDLFLAACLAVHHLAAAEVAPEPKVISTRDSEGWKVRVLPMDRETSADRMARLSAQAALNNVQIEPLNARLSEFRVSSQRRDADGQPVCWYLIRLDDQIARCSCPAPNDSICAHLSAVNAWLTETLQWERERERKGAEIPKAPVAYTNTGEYADLWED